MGLIRAAAARAKIPVLPVIGVGGRPAAQELAGLDDVCVVAHPRAASLLLVIGRPTRALLRPLLILHDQLPPPRATAWWRIGHGGDELMRAIGDVVVAPVGDAGALRRAFADVVLGARPSDPPRLPDVEWERWRGVGPYGHGGKGMTGGVPFGRPLPGRAPDPDGLELDQLPLTFGPMFPPLPPGLVLSVELQGDVVRTAAVGANPFIRWPGDATLGPFEDEAFFRALDDPVPLASLEAERARHHLRAVGASLRHHGLDAHARRVCTLARTLRVEDGDELTNLSRHLRRSRSLASAMRGVGVVDKDDALGGPVARAAGAAVDARISDPSYTSIGFEPVIHAAGDAWDRFRQRLAEADQAIALARRAGKRLRLPGPHLEGPRGPLGVGIPPASQLLIDLVAPLLVGLEWGDALTAIVSLDIDLEEAAMTASLLPGAP